MSTSHEAERLPDHARRLRLRAREIVLRNARLVADARDRTDGLLPGERVVLGLWSREKLAADTGIADDGSGWSGITLAHNVASRQEVDDLLERALTAGGTITREPSETFYGGYAGVFRDLDGHAWEIAHNPGFGLAADGSVLLGERA
jgi:catechol 2,3-dioxygenase-like lactoylglutathione lyase family enzyme